jgi:hypothetical protein
MHGLEAKNSAAVTDEANMICDPRSRIGPNVSNFAITVTSREVNVEEFSSTIEFTGHGH